MVKLSVICPTIGRISLLSLIEAYLPQLSANDELLIVGDGPQPRSKAICTSLHGFVHYIETPSKTGDFGCTPCDYAIERAKGDYVLFIGDDDLPTKNAIQIIKEGLKNRPDLPHIFAMYHTNRVLLDSVECGFVSGQQIVIPRNLSKMPKMADVPVHQWLVSDWIFINKVVNRWKGVVYHPDVICYLKKQNYGDMDE